MRFLFLLAIFLTTSCSHKTENINYKVIYKNDKEGQTVYGSKSKLIRAIRAGADIKIGWGAKGKNHRIEHLSVPIWIAVLDESEVIAHLDPQVLSEIDWSSLSANYADSTLLNKEWRVVIGTKGQFDAVWYDRKLEEVISRKPQNHSITWFARGGSDLNVPFFDSE